MGAVDSWNLTQFIRGAPLVVVDPSGLNCLPCWLDWYMVPDNSEAIPGLRITDVLGRSGCRALSGQRVLYELPCFVDRIRAQLSRRILDHGDTLWLIPPDGARQPSGIPVTPPYYDGRWGFFTNLAKVFGDHDKNGFDSSLDIATFFSINRTLSCGDSMTWRLLLAKGLKVGRHWTIANSVGELTIEFECGLPKLGWGAVQ